MNKFNKINILLISFILISIQTFGQESTAIVNQSGKDFSSLKHTWTAQWITHPSASTLDYGVFNFRRNFKLSSAPESFIIYMSADNRYRLYVNGTYICAGPSRGDIDHWRYETIDLAKYLQVGDNTIAAEVVNFGEFRPAKQQTFQTAFILQGEESNSVNVNTAKVSEWKVIKNEAYDYIPFVSDSVGGYYAAGPGDLVNGEKYTWNWQSTLFDYSDWVSPRSGPGRRLGRGKLLAGSLVFFLFNRFPFPSHAFRCTRKSNLPVLLCPVP